MKTYLISHTAKGNKGMCNQASIVAHNKSEALDQFEMIYFDREVSTTGIKGDPGS